jgi:hypothetical protein
MKHFPLQLQVKNGEEPSVVGAMVKAEVPEPDAAGNGK